MLCLCGVLRELTYGSERVWYRNSRMSIEQTIIAGYVKLQVTLTSLRHVRSVYTWFCKL